MEFQGWMERENSGWKQVIDKSNTNNIMKKKKQE